MTNLKTKIPNRTAWVPFILFTIFAGIVAYGIWKGTHSNKVAQAEDTLS